jgi:hypothetical protein
MHPQNSAVAISDDGRHVAYASGGDEKRAVAVIRSPQTHSSSTEWPLDPGFERMTFAQGRFVLMREEREVAPVEVVAPNAWRSHTVMYELRSEGSPPQKKGVFRSSEPGGLWGFLDSRLTPDAAYHVWVGPRDPPQERRVEVREVVTGRLLRRELRPTERTSLESFVRLSPDGRWLWIETGSDNRWVYDMKDEEPAERVSAIPYMVSSDLRLLAFDYKPARKRGERALGLHFGRREPLWIYIPDRGGNGVTPVEFSHDGHYAAWGSRSGTITVADLQLLRAGRRAARDTGASDRIPGSWSHLPHLRARYLGHDSRRDP